MQSCGHAVRTSRTVPRRGSEECVVDWETEVANAQKSTTTMCSSMPWQSRRCPPTDGNKNRVQRRVRTGTASRGPVLGGNASKTRIDNKVCHQGEHLHYRVVSIDSTHIYRDVAKR